PPPPPRGQRRRLGGAAAVARPAGSQPGTAHHPRPALPEGGDRAAAGAGNPAVSRPSRATAAGAAYLDLQKKAREDRRPVDELLQLYVLEGFLARLAESRFANA